MKGISGFAIALLLAGMAPIVFAQDVPRQVTASDGSAGDGFGAAMANDGSLVVVGAPRADVEGRVDQGAAYLFTRRGCDLEEIGKLVASDGGADDRFGASIAVSGGMIIVGASNASVNGQPDRGAVYVFTRSEGGWAQTDKLAAGDGLAGARFGASIAMDGERILVGAPAASGNFDSFGSFMSGAAYVFERDDSEWEERDKLMAERPEFMAGFGAAVSINDRAAIIGAPGTRNNEGAAYIFERDDDEWEQEDRIRPGGRSNNAGVGSAIAATRDHIAVSAPAGESRDTFMSGVVHVYEHDDDDVDNMAELTAGDWSANARFGGSIALTQDRLAAGAPGSGKAYLFQRDQDDWFEMAAFAAPPGGDDFGSSVVLIADLLIVGASGATAGGNAGQGAVYVYRVRDDGQE